jgi:hypothetical protein
MEVDKGFKFVIMQAFLSKSNGVRRILHPIRERKKLINHSWQML